MEVTVRREGSMEMCSSKRLVGVDGTLGFEGSRRGKLAILSNLRHLSRKEAFEYP